MVLHCRLYAKGCETLNKFECMVRIGRRLIAVVTATLSSQSAYSIGTVDFYIHKVRTTRDRCRIVLSHQSVLRLVASLLKQGDVVVSPTYQKEPKEITRVALAGTGAS